MTLTSNVVHISVLQKRLTLIGTIIAQFAMGSAYTWSLFNRAFAERLHVDVYQVACTFGIFCFMLSMASSQAVYIQKNVGVRNTTIFSAISMFIGLYLASNTTHLLVVYLGAGILLGTAEGAIYLMTLTNCVKLFPEKKGLVASLSIGAYGLGGLIFKYINYELLMTYGLGKAFLCWGVIVFILIMIGAFMMVDAPSKETQDDYTIKEVMSHKSYWGFGIIFLLTSMTGIYVIGATKDIGEALANISPVAASDAVAVLTFFNLCGRLVVGSASDKFGTLLCMRICQISLCAGIAIICYPYLNIQLFFIAVALVAFGFGGSMTIFPPLIGDFFGVQRVTKNYGFIYLGFGIGSVSANIISFLVNGFERTIPILLICMVMAVIIAICTKNKLYQEN